MGTIGAMSRNEDCPEILDAVYDAGINVFDSAFAYGDAEASLGRWIKSRKLRDKVVILTKGAANNDFRRRCHDFDILSDIHTSLAKLQTNYIDIYILHRDDPSVPVGEIVGVLDRLRREGVIGAYGGSNWSFERTKEANAYAAEHGLMPFTVCSPSYSLAECIGDPDRFKSSVTISGKKNRPFREWLHEQNISIFTYSSLARGFLTGKIKSTEADRANEIFKGWTAEEYAYPVNFERLKRAEQLATDNDATVSQIAYAWLMHQDPNIFGITAPSSAAHLKSTTDALDVSLSDHELQWLNLEE
jgi:aryl-alcohol dehydrogenase-like predicted oxidoreductase